MGESISETPLDLGISTELYETRPGDTDAGVRCLKTFTFERERVHVDLENTALLAVKCASV